MKTKLLLGAGVVLATVSAQAFAVTGQLFTDDMVATAGGNFVHDCTYMVEMTDEVHVTTYSSCPEAMDFE